EAMFFTSPNSTVTPTAGNGNFFHHGGTINVYDLKAPEDSLTFSGLDNDTSLAVIRVNGGTHYYFMNDDFLDHDLKMRRPYSEDGRRAVGRLWKRAEAGAGARVASQRAGDRMSEAAGLAEALGRSSPLGFTGDNWPIAFPRRSSMDWSMVVPVLLIAGVAGRPPAPLVHTYSIVARDPETGEMGVAVQSHYFSVGPIVPWAESGVGAVATQSLVLVDY